MVENRFKKQNEKNLMKQRSNFKENHKICLSMKQISDPVEEESLQLTIVESDKSVDEKAYLVFIY